jgi:hypothetical protein
MSSHKVFIICNPEYLPACRTQRSFYAKDPLTEEPGEGRFAFHAGPAGEEWRQRERSP